MKTAVICEQWEVNLPEPQPLAGRWFLDWVYRRPNDVSHHLACGFLAYSSLQEGLVPMDVSSVSEYFGGAGFQTRMIRNLFPNINFHAIAERSPEASRYLLRNFTGEEMFIGEQDSVSEFLPPSDLIGFDAGDLTIHTIHQGIHKDVLLYIFKNKPKAVVLTDIAGAKLPLHRERYSDILQWNCNKYYNYLEGLTAYFRRRYDYSALSVFYTRWSAVMALVPAEEMALIARPKPLPEGLVGFKWKD